MIKTNNTCKYMWLTHGWCDRLWELSKRLHYMRTSNFCLVVCSRASLDSKSRVLPSNLIIWDLSIIVVWVNSSLFWSSEICRKNIKSWCVKIIAFLHNCHNTPRKVWFCKVILTYPVLVKINEKIWNRISFKNLKASMQETLGER